MLRRMSETHSNFFLLAVPQQVYRRVKSIELLVWKMEENDISNGLVTSLVPSCKLCFIQKPRSCKQYRMCVAHRNINGENALMVEDNCWLGATSFCPSLNSLYQANIQVLDRVWSPNYVVILWKISVLWTPQARNFIII